MDYMCFHDIKLMLLRAEVDRIMLLTLKSKGFYALFVEVMGGIDPSVITGNINLYIWLALSFSGLMTLLLYKSSKALKFSNNEIMAQRGLLNEKHHEIEELLAERDWLLREIHHRVRNNLQIIMGLLNSQSFYLKDETALSAVRDSKHRIQSLALIHQKMYQDHKLSYISMTAFAYELTEYLRDSFKSKNITFVMDTDELELNVAQAIPVGLILNEAITNSLKHAFPQNQSGVIKVAIKNMGNSKVSITVNDNGIGSGGGLQNINSGTLGFELMQGLSDDIDGEFSTFTGDGTTVELNFVYDTIIN
jgi:two-component sensor histidine kinase